LFATGGEDDLMYLWAYKSDQPEKYELIMQSEKFSDSVTSLSFSCDGKYLASADMAGNIRVFLIENKTLFWSYEVGSDLETLDWHPNCNVLFCGTSDGQFIMFKLSSNEVKIMYSGSNSSVTCFKILKDGKRAACGYNNGSVRFWDLKTSETVFNITNAHQDSVMCMDLSADGNLIGTGGVDMKVNLINTNTGKSLCGLICGNVPRKKSKDEEIEVEEETIENSIETLSFCKTMPMLACGTLKGELFVWDLNSQTIRNKFENGGEGFSKVFWNPNDETLFSASLNGCVDIFDGRNLTSLKKIKCHHNEILDLCVNTTLKVIFTISTDQTVKIFKGV
jgi:WD40 repeat protein